MVKKLHLKLIQYRAVNQIAVKKWQETPLDFWPTFFLEDQNEQSDDYVLFPALEVLFLDFGNWELGVDDALEVSLPSHFWTMCRPKLLVLI